jgi:hypothetical protein
MTQMTDELAVRKSVFVRCAPEHAYRVFTERINDWWPLAGHSVFEDEVDRLVWEGRVGGRVYELAKDGEEGLWGTLIAWDPPRSFTMTWHPGRGEERAQELRISFSAEGDGTRVDLVQTGWERIGPDFRERMADYEKGWGSVLGAFVEAVDAG